MAQPSIHAKRDVTQGSTQTRPVFFVSDSTGITAETLGSALLANFPRVAFDRRTIPFVDDVDKARAVTADIARATRGGVAPLVFTTVKDPLVRDAIATAGALVIDLLDGHLDVLEKALGVAAVTRPGQYHGVGDADRYFQRMRAIEYAIEHDDGASVRALDVAQVILVAPSRCGKTPTSMHLALQHGILVANHPLTDDDFPAQTLPRPIAPFAARCFGLLSTPQRLARVRAQRRPGSRYASLAQCTLELRRAEELFRLCGIPFLDSSAKSVEEMSAVIIHTMNVRV